MNYGWLKSPRTRRRYMLSEPTGTVSHVYFDGTQLRDTQSVAWAMVGTVPQVAAASPVPAGAGPFTDANYYRVNNALHFDGNTTDYYIVYVLNRNTATGAYGVGHDGAYVAGTGLLIATGDVFLGGGAGVRSQTGATTFTPVASKVNVICVGAISKAAAVVRNKGAMVTGSAVATPAAATGYSYLGKRPDSSGYLDGVIYEALYVSGVTLTQGIADAHADRVASIVGAGNVAW